MSLPASGGTAFTTATCVKAWIEYPFNDRGDVTTKVYHHTMRVSRANYAPLVFDDVMTTADEKPTRSPFSDDAAAYWVGDTPPTAVQGDLVEFDRSFSNIPATRTESAGIYPFAFPGCEGTREMDPASGSHKNGLSTSSYTTTTNLSAVAGTFSNVDSGTAEIRYFDFVFDVTSDQADDLYLGKSLWITATGLTVEYRIGSYWYPIATDRCIVYDISGTTITARMSFEEDGSITSHRVTGTPTEFEIGVSVAQGRESFTQDSVATDTVSYTKVDDPSDIQITRRFGLLDIQGSIKDKVADYTMPSSDDYAEMIYNKDLLQASDSIVSRWRGNIWEVRDLKVPIR